MSDHRPRHPPGGVRPGRSRGRDPEPTAREQEDDVAPPAQTTPPRRSGSGWDNWGTKWWDTEHHTAPSAPSSPAGPGKGTVGRARPPRRDEHRPAQTTPPRRPGSGWDNWGTKWWDTEHYIEPGASQLQAREQGALENEHYRYSSPDTSAPSPTPALQPEEAEAWANEHYHYGHEHGDGYDHYAHVDDDRGDAGPLATSEPPSQATEAWEAWQAWATAYHDAPTAEEPLVPDSPESSPLSALVSRFESADSPAPDHRFGTSISPTVGRSRSAARASQDTPTSLGSRFDDPDSEDDESGRPRSLPLVLGALMLLAGGGVGGVLLLGQQDEGNDNSTGDAASQNADPTETGSATTVPRTTAGSEPTTTPESTTATTEPVDETTAASTTEAAADTTSPATTDGATPPDASSPDQSPEQVAEAYYGALMSGDCETAVSHISQQVMDRNGGRDAMMQDCEATSSQMALVGDRMQVQDYVLVDQTADTATVEAIVVVDMGNGPMEQRQPLHLVLEDGAWKFSEW